MDTYRSECRRCTRVNFFQGRTDRFIKHVNSLILPTFSIPRNFSSFLFFYFLPQPPSSFISYYFIFWGNPNPFYAFCTRIASLFVSRNILVSVFPAFYFFIFSILVFLAIFISTIIYLSLRILETDLCCLFYSKWISLSLSRMPLRFLLKKINGYKILFTHVYIFSTTISRIWIYLKQKRKYIWSIWLWRINDEFEEKE